MEDQSERSIREPVQTSPSAAMGHEDSPIKGRTLCPRCSGRGEIEGKTCAECSGTGYVSSP